MATAKDLVIDADSGGLVSVRMAAALQSMKEANAVPATVGSSELAFALESMEEVIDGSTVIECDPGPVRETDGYKFSHATIPGYPDLSGLTTRKVPHKDMILDDVCTNCACCGQPLTDSVSVQRGLGPRCSRKGYSEDPVDSEEMDAFIYLAEYQELIDFLTEHYKPLGVRGLVNGLVRVASLNRPRGSGQEEGNEKLFRACCDAIEALGYPKMANLLRDTLVVAWLTKSDEPGEEGISYLRTKAYRTPDWFYPEARKLLRGETWDPKSRTYKILMHKPGRPSDLVESEDAGKSNKRVVWELLLKAFEGYAVKIDGNPVPIRVKSSA